MLKVGDHIEIHRKYSQDDINGYCELADVDPILINSVPEPLIAAMYSDMLGTKLPGPGTMYMKQTSNYIEAAPIEVILTAKVEVTKIRPKNGLVNLRTTCVDENGKLLCDGGALVLYPQCKDTDSQ